MIDPQGVYEAAWKLLYSEVSDTMKNGMRDVLGRAFEEEYQKNLQEEAEREAARRSKA